MCQGNILKMKSELANEVQYYLPIGDQQIHLNELIGNHIHLEYLNQINCIKCGRKTNKSFQQGYCYPCFMTAPETDSCILHPETCLAQEGISRDMNWAEQNCLQNHYVYLAVSSGLKVGVTRQTQVPTRWIDQGANRAIKIALTPNRYTAGLIEVELKKYMADKTNWRNMLTNKIDGETDLLKEKENVWKLLDSKAFPFYEKDNSILYINYPVANYPEKVKSVSFDKESTIDGKLSGIKGQYLIFDDNRVLNIRKHNGYLIRMKNI